MSTYQNKVKGQVQLADRKDKPDLSSFPIDLSSALILPHGVLDQAGVPCQKRSPSYNPTTIAHYALAHWNHYLITNDEGHRSAFLTQACWLIEHEARIGEDAGGWPVSFTRSQFHTQGPRLSAVTQGCGLSVLMRAFQLTQDEAFLDVAYRVARTFELDVLDGGVNVPVGTDGIFFEEVAVYPAAHTLSGFVFALFGLYDYVALAGDTRFEKLIQRGLTTMHSLLEEFDAGFWTYAELLQRRLASPTHLAHQVTLLEALARNTSCDRCSAVAARWRKYQRQPGSRLRYQIASRCHRLLGQVQTALFPRPQILPSTQVCIPISAFPMMGGVLTVLEGIAHVMKDRWHIEYLTQHIGPGAEKYTIRRFGSRRMVPWSFPFVWLYVLSGARKIFSLMRKRGGYHVIMPQDGVATAALAGLAGKLTGVRVVCIDHGDLSLFTDRIRRVYGAEYLRVVATKPWPLRLALKGLLVAYWPSRYLLGHIAARSVDHFLIPGVAGDSVEEGCKIIGIPASRITRYGSMIDINRHVLPDAVSRATQRQQLGVAVDAIIIAIACRLSSEKGINIALESISQALVTLPASQRTQVRVLIAGDGPLRKQVEEGICQFGLSHCCTLLGDLSADKIITLLGMSDIFLYTSTRGACFAMAVLEAMASGCAVIASTEPLSNAILLAEGRGIVVRPGEVAETSKALNHLLNDVELCHRMGLAARDHIAVHHSPALFRRNLLRATSWSGLDELLTALEKIETRGIESGS
jgi:glycosyltransferase involved in cell wall biosynthesis